MIRIILSTLLFVTSALLCIQQPQVPPFPQASPNGMITPIPGMSDFSMTEAEFNEMLEFLSTLKPEELEELEKVGRGILMEQGIDPDTLQPIPGAQQPGGMPQRPIAPPPVRETPTVPKPEEPKVAAQDVEDVVALVSRLSRRVESLMHKLSAQPRRDTPLKSLVPELAELSISLRLMGNKDLALRLATPESTLLKQALQTLDAVFTAYEERALIPPTPPVRDEEDPYSILGVPYTASEDDIEEAFAVLSDTKSPEVVRAKKVSEGLAGKDLERSIKDARRTFAFIEDAYEKLRDPKMRAHVDRQHAALIDAEKQALERSRSAEQAIAEAFTNAIYSERLLDEGESFFKRYEPTALALKKSMEAEEAARRQEMEQATYITPYPTYGSYDLPSRVGDGGGSSYQDSGSYYPPSSNSFDFGSSEQPQYPSFGESPEERAKGGERGSGAKSSGGEKAEKNGKDEKGEEKGKDKDADKKDAKAPGKPKSGDDKKKKKEKTPPELMDELGKQLKNFDEIVKSPEAAVLLTPLAEYLRKPVTDDIPVDATLNARIDEFSKALDIEKIEKTLQAIDKGIEPLLIKNTKGDKELPKKTRDFYRTKWTPIESGIAQIRVLHKQIDAIITSGDTPVAPERMVAHSGTLTEPQPLGTLQKKLGDSTKLIEKIEKLLFPERFVKPPSDGAPKPPPVIA